MKPLKTVKLLACVFAASAAITLARADDAALAPPQAAVLANVHFKQRLDNQVPLDLPLTNDRGDRATLRETLAGRPAVFVLAYYRCPMLCNQVLNGMARTLRSIDYKPGEDFEVVVVSFDPSDTVELAREKKKNVVAAFTREGDDQGWHFMIGDQSTVAAIAESVGFGYEYDAKSDQFAHASGIVLLTPEGRVSRYYYGIDYPTRDVRLGLVEASAGRIGSAVDEILLFCFHYDPLTGRYGLAIMRVIRAGGVLTVACIGIFIMRSLRNEQLEKASALVTPRSAEGSGNPLAIEDGLPDSSADLGMTGTGG